MGFEVDKIETNSVKNTVFAEGLQLKYHSKLIASLGTLNPNLLEKFEIDQSVQYADLDWTAILKKSDSSIRYKEILKYPAVKRDLALILDNETEFETIRSLAFQVERKLLKEVSLFDVFESDKLGKGKKSYAISFILQDEFKTLVDKKVEKVMKSLISSFEDKLGATLRK
jgi:phenylalanyl-tRNA synthetase beta chain